MTVHKRLQETNIAMCGVGYPWPSTISFARKDEEVDCQNCLEKTARIVNHDRDCCCNNCDLMGE